MDGVWIKGPVKYLPFCLYRPSLSEVQKSGLLFFFVFVLIWTQSRVCFVILMIFERQKDMAFTVRGCRC